MGIVRTFYRTILLSAHVLLGVVLCVLLLPKDQQKTGRLQRRVTHWWLRVCGRLMGLAVRVHGWPAPEGAYLVSNHISWLDVLVIGSVQPVRFLAKSEISRWPLIGYLARRAGTLFIKRGQGVQSATQAITDSLQKGHSVVVFPEGTTSDGRQVKPFYPRLFSAAENHKTLIQPVALGYPSDNGAHADVPFIDDESFFKNLLKLMPLKKLSAAAYYTEPLRQNGGRKNLAEQAHRQVSWALQRIYEL